MTQDKNRRKNPRIATELPLRLAHGSDYFDVLCQDINMGGAHLLSKEALTEGSFCSVRLLAFEKEQPEVKAQVVWQRHEMNGTNKFALGIRFLPEDNKEGLEEILDFVTTSHRRNQQRKESRQLLSLKGWRFPHPKFFYNKRIYLKHTNLEGNTYYDNFVTWHGEAREALLLSHPNINSFLAAENVVKMITHSVHQRYIRDAYFGDSLRIEVTSREIKQCSFILVFRFYNQTNKLIGEGWQKICFADLKTKKICRVPSIILDLIEPISERGQFIK